jgi:tripeptidyl-peptidase-1
MEIALTQKNLHQAESYFMDISHPESTNFGKHWSTEQVADTFAPSTNAIDAVTYWLKSSGISNYSQGKNRGWIRFNATVEQAELILETNYHIYLDEASGEEHLACDEHHVPKMVQQHIDFITPTIQLVPSDIHKRTPETKRNVDYLPLKLLKSLSKPIFPDELTNCSTMVTPACIRAAYGIPVSKTYQPQEQLRYSRVPRAV